MLTPRWEKAKAGPARGTFYSREGNRRGTSPSSRPIPRRAQGGEEALPCSPPRLPFHGIHVQVFSREIPKTLVRFRAVYL